MNPDEQEAKSLAYIDALRVVLLSSGRLAVFDMRKGEFLGAFAPEEITGARLAEWAQDQRARAAAYFEAYEKAQERKRAGGAAPTPSLADLGLA